MPVLRDKIGDKQTLDSPSGPQDISKPRTNRVRNLEGFKGHQIFDMIEPLVFNE